MTDRDAHNRDESEFEALLERALRIDVPEAGKKKEGAETGGTASGNGERNEKKHE